MEFNHFTGLAPPAGRRGAYCDAAPKDAYSCATFGFGIDGEVETLYLGTKLGHLSAWRVYGGRRRTVLRFERRDDLFALSKKKHGGLVNAMIFQRAQEAANA
eukprot:CAMPEP_0118876352 /NCGR_PEP_ID=MMETSP1163-20130328/17084_1 /TAXON_ID=124430 /ORGANISM="Phaeomonas parva, Strain CCMP2877" /LENGTH=101 /DNA_ID=CAMNT_0006811959 /DNA_START=254 /DNA_END=555 /DNA_ORIENTATION=-